jgi:hypothetical protein
VVLSQIALYEGLLDVVMDQHQDGQAIKALQ